MAVDVLPGDFQPNVTARSGHHLDLMFAAFFHPPWRFRPESLCCGVLAHHACPSHLQPSGVVPKQRRWHGILKTMVRTPLPFLLLLTTIFAIPCARLTRTRSS